MKVFDKICDILAKILSYVSFAGFVIIMLFIVLNVVTRTIFNAPVLGAFEIVEVMMMVGVFTSFAYAQRQGSHIRITMLLMHIPRPVAMAICTLTGLISTATICVLTYAAFKQFELAFNFNYVSAMLKFPMWPFYIVEIITCAVFALNLLADTLKHAIGIGNAEMAAELTKDWV